MQSDENIFNIFEGELLDRAKLEAVMVKMVAKTNAEPGTLNYEWMVSEDGKSCAFYERYADADAMLEHVRGFGEFAADFMSAVKPTGFKVYGDASAELKATLADLGATYYGRIGGFVR